ncbi:hypothetical protein [Rhodococcus tukisamuensis]|uniref:hypothetical protein n=1 Tax=Rhodococcus tukisamuensis TaxID=168276 RepID=UPI00093389C5|nr:hypothetical protein [Rhodococcus tukisamuensis]
MKIVEQDWLNSSTERSPRPIADSHCYRRSQVSHKGVLADDRAAVARCDTETDWFECGQLAEVSLGVADDQEVVVAM